MSFISTLPQASYAPGSPRNRYCRRVYQPGHGKFEVEDPAPLLTELSTSTPRERAVAAAMRGHDDL